MPDFVALFHSWTAGQTWQTVKDEGTFTIALIGFVLSLAAWWQKRSETKTALRKQLTDILEKVHETNVEFSKFRDEKLQQQYPKEFGRVIGDRRRFLVRQAVFLAGKILALVSPYEMMVIAIGLEDIDDLPAARKWFERAKSETTGEFDKVIVRRQFGRYLFRQGFVDEARSEYENALRQLKGTSDRHKVYQGDTYERWADLEVEFGGTRESVEDLLLGAFDEYALIRSKPVRDRQIKRLFELSNRIGVIPQYRDLEQETVKAP